MRYVVDTSILIDVLRGDPRALKALEASLGTGSLHSSEIVRLEVLAGMRPSEESATRSLFEPIEWHPVDSRIAEIAGGFGREFLPGNRGIDAADLVVAATASALDARLLTRNVKHFPMFDGLSAPY